jgi:hypothetical protein
MNEQQPGVAEPQPKKGRKEIEMAARNAKRRKNGARKSAQNVACFKKSTGTTLGGTLCPKPNESLAIPLGNADSISREITPPD